MTLHNMAVFLHVVGALILFGAQAIELVGFDRLRKATTAESAMTVMGPVIAGPRMGPIARIAASSTGALSSELTRLIWDPVLVVSFYTRSATALGIVLLMVAKPAPLIAVVVIAVAAGVGFAVGRSVLGRAELADKNAVPVETAS